MAEVDARLRELLLPPPEIPRQRSRTTRGLLAQGACQHRRHGDGRACGRRARALLTEILCGDRQVMHHAALIRGPALTTQRMAPGSSAGC